MLASLTQNVLSSVLPTGQTARNFSLELKYEGKDISLDVAPFVENFKFVDRTLPDAMDEISVTFQDIDGLWRGEWFPEQGAKFAAKIGVDNWFAQGDHFERNCGTFEIDDLSSSGFPSIFTIKAIAVGISNSIRRQQNTKPWEKINIKTIAEEIASKHGFELKWYSAYNPIIERWEQKSESDLACLKKICEYAGLMLKITDKAIVIFRGEQFDKQKPEITIRMEGDGVKSGWSMNSNSADIYSACQVSYYDPDEKKFLEYLFKPEGVSGIRGGATKKEKSGGNSGWNWTNNAAAVSVPKPKQEEPPEINDPEVGQVLKLNQRFKSLAEAQEMAKAALRSKNMRQLKGSMSLIGRPDYYSGLNAKIEGFGRWDSSVWQIEEVSHEWSKSAGYGTEIQMRGVLGY